MRGDAGIQYKNIYIVVGFGEGTFTWLNTATGDIGHARYNTYEEAQEVIDYMVKEIHARSTGEAPDAV